MTITDQLTQLENAQLLRRYTDEELTYIFKHALVHDTAYQSLLKQDRKHLHRIVGEIIEGTYPSQLDENAALLAQHFAQAGEPVKAIAFAQRAARRSVDHYALEEAVRQLETALTWAEPDQVGDPYLALIEETGDANRLVRNGERALALYQQAIGLWTRRNGTSRWNVIRLHRKIVQTVVLNVKWAVGVDVMRRANKIGNASRARLEAELKLVPSTPPQPEMAEALTALAIATWGLASTPDWDAAERFAAAAVAMAEQLSDPSIQSHALDALASVYDGRGRLRKHLEVTLRRLAAAQSPKCDDLREKIDALRGVGMAHMFLGEYAQALSPLREAERLAEDIQAIDLHAMATGLQAQCLFRMDRWDAVLELEKKWRPLVARYSRERVGVT